MRKWDEFKGIQGEAYNCPVDLLKPKEKGEKRVYPTLDLLVKWQINSVVSRTWETRSLIKHLWPNPSQCNEYIHKAAKHHAKQHADWLSGQLTATSKSPSPGPGVEGLKPQGTPPPPGPEVKTEPKEKPSMSAMLDYREEWCALEGLDPAKMTPEDKANFLLTWNLMKLKL